MFEIFFFGVLSVESPIYAGIFGSLDYIPQLAFAVGVMTLDGYLIVGVHLNGELLAGIKKLYQQRKLLTKSFIDTLAHQIAHIDLDEFIYIIASQASVLHSRDCTLD